MLVDKRNFPSTFSCHDAPSSSFSFSSSNFVFRIEDEEEEEETTRMNFSCHFVSIHGASRLCLDIHTLKPSISGHSPDTTPRCAGLLQGSRND
jgi:hypothetical protein